MSKNAGKVILLKNPNTTMIPRNKGAKRGVCCCDSVSHRPPMPLFHGVFYTVLTGTATVLSIKTKLQATTSVSIAFEKVCVWYVQVT